MLLTGLRSARIAGVGRFLLLLVATFFVLPAYAQDEQISSLVPATVSAQTMLENIAEQIPQLMQMITAIAYVMGMYFMFLGILHLKRFGEQRTMMSQEHSLKGPLIYLTVGALLLYLPTTVWVGMSTFWTNPNPYGYEEYTDQWAEFLNVCFLIIQFVGTIAFIKGLVIMTHLGGHGQPGQFSRGLTHIIGGVLCINIYETVQVILVTLGLQPL
ncbi:hypothetical protein [Aquicella lusitana]|uniref:Uncharacterized protein n=1 Tax=Aquicella lusitana TaxID=254246 RepID=A0A370GY91_9COXI|nr:hypothetical protein [Aquicella lusitana]RDI48618.1 hypothetical protein C8D86_10246 [Aquicella lusitana]VVC74005.1 hypothetical protein AQULUS_17670 [Aquicella lusitana]